MSEPPKLGDLGLFDEQQRVVDKFQEKDGPPIKPKLRAYFFLPKDRTFSKTANLVRFTIEIGGTEYPIDVTEFNFDDTRFGGPWSKIDQAVSLSAMWPHESILVDENGESIASSEDRPFQPPNDGAERG